MRCQNARAKPPGTTVLYDGGGGILALQFLGVPLAIAGIAADCLWNLLILWATLSLLQRHVQPDPADRGPGMALALEIRYSLIITVCGFVIDLLYWAIATSSDERLLQFALILMPMAMLWLANLCLSLAYLKLKRSQAVWTATSMAVFTAPWLIAILMH